MEDYKKSSTFEYEMIEVGAFNYEISYNDYKEKVEEDFLTLDLHKVVVDREEAVEGGDEEDEIQEEMEKEAPTKEAALSIATTPEYLQNLSRLKKFSS